MDMIGITGTPGGMNSNINFAMQQQMQQMDEMRRKNSVGPDLGATSSPPPGSLIIADFFTPSQPGDQYSHGEVVNMAAKQNGFRGPVFTQNQPTSQGATMAQTRAEHVLTNPNASREDILRAVSERTAARAVSNVESQTQVVRNATASGAKNSALNISMGTSKAGVTADLYGQASLAWSSEANAESKEYGTVIAGNFSKAYELDMAKLQSQDPEVSGPERLKLQQHLVNHVDHTFSNNSRMKEAKQQWSTEVRRFESNNNSVVVSAGNEGDASEFMAKDAGGRRMRVPPDYETNVLEIPEVTSVGATRWSNGPDGPTETRAQYSNRSQGVDIYASGSVDYDGDQKADDFGTSFSSPRVAATMAALHGQNPNMSSSQIENLMRNQLTHDLNGGSQGEIKVLDYQKSSDFLVGRK
jgi:hypothetical protein